MESPSSSHSTKTCARTRHGRQCSANKGHVLSAQTRSILCINKIIILTAILLVWSTYKSRVALPDRCYGRSTRQGRLSTRPHHPSAHTHAQHNDSARSTRGSCHSRSLTHTLSLSHTQTPTVAHESLHTQLPCGGCASHLAQLVVTLSHTRSHTQTHTHTTNPAVTARIAVTTPLTWPSSLTKTLTRSQTHTHTRARNGTRTRSTSGVCPLAWRR
jgi:hypothetical protein